MMNIRSTKLKELPLVMEIYRFDYNAIRFQFQSVIRKIASAETHQHEKQKGQII